MTGLCVEGKFGMFGADGNESLYRMPASGKEDKARQRQQFHAIRIRQCSSIETGGLRVRGLLDAGGGFDREEALNVVQATNGYSINVQDVIMGTDVTSSQGSRELEPLDLPIAFVLRCASPRKTESTGGEVANASACKAGIRGFESHPGAPSPVPLLTRPPV